ncbi:MAG: acyl-CoA dehydrogenase family protein [Rhodopseudomonas palustris]|uniref:3-sulfinopropanoyl-CoA desulfinase n=1 Tax=Rhodopseudomonas palustris TaxID=1076 RepID=A0A933RTH0_RHOPL|nr:acyl-CoA dehydrogenase family protein [Rhodopseudomonas palustris]
MRLAEEGNYQDFRNNLRRFVERDVAPHAAAVDREGRPPIEAITAALSLGLPGLPFPERLGGSDGDLFAQVITTEELARGCASASLTITSGWVLEGIVKYGSPEIQELVLPPICRGEMRGAWGLTEPQGGSNLMGARTSAKSDGTDWVLDGTKRFITNAGWADWYLIFARTGEKTFGIFMIHRDDPGIRFGKAEDKMGMRGSPTADVILDGCRVPAGRVVGDPARGGEYIVEMLHNSRLTIAAHALGLAQGSLDEALKYTQERRQFDQTISRFQAVRVMIADMALKVEAARSVLYQAVDYRLRNHPDARRYASLAKVLCSDAAMSVSTDAVQLHGGYGYLKDYPIERMMRDSKITQIWEGTNQIQRLLIAKETYASC